MHIFIIKTHTNSIYLFENIYMYIFIFIELILYLNIFNM